MSERFFRLFLLFTTIPLLLIGLTANPGKSVPLTINVSGAVDEGGGIIKPITGSMTIDRNGTPHQPVSGNVRANNPWIIGKVVLWLLKAS